jgi:hypothetical protein
MSYQARKRHGGHSNDYYSVKEANIKRQHNIGFRLHDILKEVKPWKQERVMVFPGVEGKKEWLSEALGIFQTAETIMYVFVIDKCHYHLHKPIEWATQRMNSNVNYSLQK